MKSKVFLKLFWLSLIGIIILQGIYTFNSMLQIRYEELAEAVRNPFWMNSGYIYDGISGSLAWYGSLAVFYNLFGFSLFTAKIIRLSIFALSLLTLGLLLRRFLGIKWAIAALFVIGLSPTLLYFNILQTTYGLDLCFIPILLYIISKIDFLKKQYFLFFLTGFLSIFFSLFYPTFLFFLPSVFIYIGIRIFKKQDIKKASFQVLSLASGILMPLLFFFVYIKNREWLIFDPNTKSGLFRGSGKLILDFSIFTSNIKEIGSDLFYRAQSYYFEVAKVEFSDLYPLIALGLIGYVIFRIFKEKSFLRFYALLIFLCAITTLILAGFSYSEVSPGIRRSAPLIACFYGLFILSLIFLKSKKGKSSKYLIICIVSILLIHQSISYIFNFNSIKTLSLYANRDFFAQNNTPDKSLDRFIDQIRISDLRLGCRDLKGHLIECRYSEIYSAVAGYCSWNNLNCHKVLGYSIKTKDFIPLGVELWNNYHFGH